MLSVSGGGHACIAMGRPMFVLRSEGSYSCGKPRDRTISNVNKKRVQPLWRYFNICFIKVSNGPTSALQSVSSGDGFLEKMPAYQWLESVNVPLPWQRESSIDKTSVKLNVSNICPMHFINNDVLPCLETKRKVWYCLRSRWTRWKKKKNNKKKKEERSISVTLGFPHPYLSSAHLLNTT